MYCPTCAEVFCKKVTQCMKNVWYEDSKLRSSQLWDRVILMVSTDDLAWTYCCNHPMACVDRIRMLLQNIHYHVCTRLYGVLTETTLWILTTVSTSNPIPKIIKNWNADGNVTLGKLNYTRAVYIITQYLISHSFSTAVYIVI